MSESKKQTAVEWLADELHGFIHPEHGKDFLPILAKAKAMEKEQSIHKLFVGFQEWHQNEYGSKYVEIDQFNEYLETFKSE